MISLLRYTPNMKTLWDDFLIQEAQNTTFLFQREFIDYHQDRFTDHSLLFFRDQQLIAILPANIKQSILHSHQGLSYGGFILSKSFSSDWVTPCLKALKKFMQTQRLSLLRIKRLPEIYIQPSSCKQLLELFYQQSTLHTQEANSVIDLQEVNSYNTLKKRLIRRAFKNRLTTSYSNNWKGYWEILTTNLRTRFNAEPVHTLQEILMLKERFPKHIQLLVTQSEENELLAGTVLFIHATTIHTQYLSNSPKGREVAALDWTIHQLIHNSKQTHHYLSLGTSIATDGQTNLGLKRWKEGFGTQDFFHEYRVFDFS